jgi:hypothetical protein
MDRASEDNKNLLDWMVHIALLENGGVHGVPFNAIHAARESM